MAMPTFVIGGVATISSLKWDADLEAPAPYNIKSNCLKKVTLTPPINNIINIQNITYTLNTACVSRSDYPLKWCDNLNMATTITDLDKIYVVDTDHDFTCLTTCDNDIFYIFNKNEILSDEDVLLVTAEFKNSMPSGSRYVHLIYSYCIDNQYGINAHALVLSNFTKLSETRYTGTLTVKQFKDMIIWSNNKCIFGYGNDGVRGDIGSGGLNYLKFERLNSVQTAALREPARALTRTEYNTLHNIVDDDTQPIVQR